MSGTIYEIMMHNLQHGHEEAGVSTFLHRREDGGLALQYHATDVVVAYEDGVVVLNSGGYSKPRYAFSTSKKKTSSPFTRGRISRYLPTGYSLYQDRNIWWLQFPNGDVVEFIDGMSIIERDQRAFYPGDENTAQAYQAHFRANVLARIKSAR